MSSASVTPQRLRRANKENYSTPEAMRPPTVAPPTDWKKYTCDSITMDARELRLLELLCRRANMKVTNDNSASFCAGGGAGACDSAAAAGGGAAPGAAQVIASSSSSSSSSEDASRSAVSATATSADVASQEEETDDALRDVVLGSSVRTDAGNTALYGSAANADGSRASSSSSSSSSSSTQTTPVAVARGRSSSILSDVSEDEALQMPPCVTRVSGSAFRSPRSARRRLPPATPEVPQVLAGHTGPGAQQGGAGKGAGSPSLRVPSTSHSLTSVLETPPPAPAVGKE
jgi:hypothetical protein